jgi:hypothetical protein
MIILKIKKLHLIIGFKHWQLEGRNSNEDEWILIDDRILDETPEIGTELSFYIYDVEEIENEDGTITTINHPFKFSQIRLSVIDSLIYIPTEDDSWNNITRICCYK